MKIGFGSNYRMSSTRFKGSKYQPMELEMGAITRRCYDLGAPAAFFENIKG